MDLKNLNIPRPIRKYAIKTAIVKKLPARIISRFLYPTKAKNDINPFVLWIRKAISNKNWRNKKE